MKKVEMHLLEIVEFIIYVTQWFDKHFVAKMLWRWVLNYLEMFSTSQSSAPWSTCNEIWLYLQLLLHLLTSNVGGDQRSGSGGTSEASGIGSCWSYHSGAEDFNSLMAKLCEDFESNQEESKFELCDTIRAVLRSFPKVRMIMR